jgi:hypothetical protein
MRTTLTLDDDLAGVLKRKSRELGKPFKELVNATLRQGLASELSDTSHKIVSVRPHDFGVRPGLDLDRLNQLNDQLEVEAYLKREGQDDSARH